MKSIIQKITRIFLSRSLIDTISLIVFGCMIGIAVSPSIYFLTYLTLKLSFLDILIFSLSVGLGYLVFGIILMLESFLIIKILRIKSQPELFEIKLYSLQMLKFSIYHGLLNICDFFFLRLIRSTILINFFYRCLGMVIGKNTVINTTIISDCDIIKIGKNTVIGGGVVINGHSAEDGKIIRAPVKIGNNVTIGQYTTILPGVKIEDNAVIGANSLIPKNSIVKSDKKYGGVPIHEIKDKNLMKLSNNYTTEDSSKENEIIYQNINQVDILLKSYNLRHDETMNIERYLTSLTISTFGLIFTIITYSLLNNQQNLLSLLPLLLFLSYSISINLNIGMLKLGFHMAKIELLFKKSDVKDFDWELKEGILGSTRSMELDNVFIIIIYLIIVLIGLYFTYTGVIVSDKDLFIGFSLRKIIIVLDIFGIFWSFFVTSYYFIKRKSFINKLKL